MAKIFGWTDEVTACDCCGKSDLSGTFCVELDDGAQVHYGSVCVKKAGNSLTLCDLFDARDAYRRASSEKGGGEE